MSDFTKTHLLPKHSLDAILDHDPNHINAYDSILNYPYLGFCGESEYYIRPDNADSYYRFKMGTFLISLSELCTDYYVNQWSHIYDLLALDSSNIESCLSSFISLFCSEYEYFASLHICLADLFLKETLLAPRWQFDCADSWDSIYFEIFGDFSKWYSFDIATFKRVLGDKAISANQYFASYLSSLCNNLYSFSYAIREFGAGISYLLANILVRGDKTPSPLIRYFNFRNTNPLDDGLNNKYFIKSINFTGIESRCDATIEITCECLRKMKEHLFSNSGWHKKELIHDITMGPYDPHDGFRLLDVFALDDYSNASFSEIQYMCANGMELACCKNCGKLFIPLAVTSNFCDRFIDGDNQRTCKSDSSKWYVKQRRDDDPIFDEFTRYRLKYASRTSRSKLKNPPERLAQWTERAKQLINDCEAGIITMDEFSLRLREMDEEMKPLDKMK